MREHHCLLALLILSARATAQSPQVAPPARLEQAVSGLIASQAALGRIVLKFEAEIQELKAKTANDSTSAKINELTQSMVAASAIVHRYESEIREMRQELAELKRVLAHPNPARDR